MAYTTNRFCWQGLVTTDIDRTSAFYPKVLGWTIQQMPMGDEVAHVFAAADVAFAHFMPPQVEGMPTHWNNYLRVDSVDATIEKAVAAGGQVLFPATDIAPGRFALLASPSGAAISLFKEADPSSEHHPGGPGSVHWVELHSKDIAADKDWLVATFGFDIGEMPMPNGTTYYLLKDGDEQRGGAMQAMFEEAPSMWLTWFQVEDADATAAAIQKEGGQLHSELMDMPGVGRMAVCADPTGGVFGIIKPAHG